MPNESLLPNKTIMIVSALSFLLTKIYNAILVVSYYLSSCHHKDPSIYSLFYQNVLRSSSQRNYTHWLTNTMSSPSTSSGWEKARHPLNRQKYYSDAFFDVKQTFDMAWHMGLLFKLKLPVPCYQILPSCLTKRLI